MAKLIEAQRNSRGGYDLLTERDAGNQVLILTGDQKRSKEFWQRLAQTCEEVLGDIEAQEYEENIMKHPG